MKYYRKILYLLKKKKRSNDLGYKTNLLVKQRKEKYGRLTDGLETKVEERSIDHLDGNEHE